MSKPKEFWLVPWSVGFECRTKKPDGNSIHVINKSAYDELYDFVANLTRPSWQVEDIAQFKTFTDLQDRAHSLLENLENKNE